MKAGVEGWLHLPVRMGEVPDDELIGDHQGSDRQEGSAEHVVQSRCGVDRHRSREDWNDPLLRETVPPQQIQEQWGE